MKKRNVQTIKHVIGVLTAEGSGNEIIDHCIRELAALIEKDGFKVIVDANGDILTDMQLLAKLRTLRQTIAQENGVAASRIMYDSVLVLLATDRPLTREEFIDIKGITISTYMRFGERFIAEIKKHVES